MELIQFLSFLAVVLPVAYGAPTQAANSLHPQILEAMKRDLGLNAEQSTARVAQDFHFSNLIDQARKSVGDSFAGGWIDTNVVYIGITDPTLAGSVKATGASPIIMSNSFSKLQNAKSALDKMFIGRTRAATSATPGINSGIAAYYIDVTANKLVIEALSESHGRAQELASQAGLTESDFVLKTVKAMPTTKVTVQGGDAYYINGAARCSIGFSVTSGYVSAGHCGNSGDSATTSGGESLGTFSGSIFPGNDMSYVATVSGAVLSGTVDGYGQGDISVSGSAEAEVGASICRSGSTTGVHCGTVNAKDATVNYAEGSVSGLTQTNVCAEPGDSGGSFYSGSQAQGVTSGGDGDCTNGGTTYFQPVNPILQNYGLTLVTS
ncbi:Putative Chymotrypsin (Precursor) [[Torrubiella] hemipterigena]|uniref:Putative Chymotrypsin (Precursor) n=1 Tax=[Torrubiella] hemipterigena TaxID=1531966 RepID=A0A0A1T566_9HYPO|nr:Putative Chymotrypsin (Precursor) [[Torrubiella] hemipterigena]